MNVPKSRQVSTQMLNFRKIDEIVLRRAHRCDLRWLSKSGYTQYLLRFYMHSVAPRQKIISNAGVLNEKSAEESYADKILEMIGTVSFEELECRVEEDNDPAAMLKLADFLMVAIKMESNNLRDPDRACKLYYDSACLRYPEGNIAYALLCYHKLTEELTSAEEDSFLKGSISHRIPPGKYGEKLYLDMWNNLEWAAEADHNCPFMMRMVEWHDNPSFDIPIAVLRCWHQRMEQYRSQKNKCNNPVCPADPDAAEFKVFACSKCKCRYYCSVICQKYCWKSGHKKECDSLLKYYSRASRGFDADRVKEVTERMEQDMDLDAADTVIPPLDSLLSRFLGDT